MTKWLKQVRALPSDPTANDFLKIEYIDVNLNNSRKLIGNITGLTAASKATTTQTEEVVENLLRLRTAREQLSWTEGLVRDDTDN